MLLRLLLEDLTHGLLEAIQVVGNQSYIHHRHHNSRASPMVSTNITHGRRVRTRMESCEKHVHAKNYICQAHTHSHAQGHTHSLTCARTYTHTHSHTYTYTHTHTHPHMGVYTYIYIYLPTHTGTYMHTHTHNPTACHLPCLWKCSALMRATNARYLFTSRKYKMRSFCRRITACESESYARPSLPGDMP
jgi:hypothetical protein